jgi:hypothetical protein
MLWLAMAGERSQIEDPYKIGIFRHLLFFQDYQAAPLYALVLLVAIVPAFQSAGLAVAGWCSRHVLAVAGLTALALGLGTHAVYHAHPLSMDEYAPVFQSAVFAEGRLAGQFPPDLVPWLIARGFLNVFFKADAAGQVVSSYWPGHALLLAPFTLLGASWLLNPLLGGATVLVMHRLARELLGKAEWAGLVVLLTLASPAVTINAVSYYSMPAHLLANAAFAMLLVRPSAPRAFLAGVIGSIALVLHNPVPHLLFSVPWIVWLALHEKRLKLIAAIAAGYLPISLLVGFGWAWYYRSIGSPLTALEVAAKTGPGSMLWQFWRNVLELPSHDMLMNRFWALGKLWLWSTPALIALAIAGLFRVHRQAVWRVLAGCAVLTLSVYFFVPFDQGHGWGFRYFHATWLVLPLFAVAAIAPMRGSNEASSFRLHGYLAACAMLSLVLMTSLRAIQVEGFISRHLAQVPVAPDGETRVTIVEPLGGYYLADLAQNDPFLRQRSLVLVTRGPSRDEVMMSKRFPQYTLLYKDRRGSVWGLR